MGRHGLGHSPWDNCNDPDEWLIGLTRGVGAVDEPEGVNRLITLLFDRKVLSRLKRVKTSLRRRDGSSSADQKASGVE